MWERNEYIKMCFIIYGLGNKRLRNRTVIRCSKFGTYQLLRIGLRKYRHGRGKKEEK